MDKYLMFISVPIFSIVRKVLRSMLVHYHLTTLDQWLRSAEKAA